MSTSTLTVTPLGGHLGARVEQVDLSAPLDPATKSALLDALHEHLVLFFPGQHLSGPAHFAFALQFGDVFTHPISRLAGRTTTAPEHIVDDVDHPPFQDQWHTDVSWVDAPPRIGTLRAIELPARGGDTLWANMYEAYERLSPAMKRMLQGVDAEHWLGEGKAFEDKSGAGTVARRREQFPPVPPPVIIDALDYLVPSGRRAGDRFEPRRITAPFPEPLKLPAGSRELAIHYTAASFTAPEKVRFRCKFDRHEFGWHVCYRHRYSSYRVRLWHHAS